MRKRAIKFRREAQSRAHPRSSNQLVSSVQDPLGTDPVAERSGFIVEIDQAVHWLLTQIRPIAETHGWGWVQDVPPNPQNTAEVVCALLDAEHDIPHLPDVVALLEKDEVSYPGGARKWSFANNMDVAWRLQALIRLRAVHEGVVDDDSVERLASLLRERQTPNGGWAFDKKGLDSVVATAAAVEALAMMEDSATDETHVFQGLEFLRKYVRTASIEDGIAPLARALQTLSLKSIRINRPRSHERLIRRRAGDILLRMKQGDLGVEEEVFQRDDIEDSWRHLCLPLALGALIRVAPNLALEPAFRAGLVRLMDLQDQTGPTRGGVRTSIEGFVTSYATSHFVSTVVSIQRGFRHEIRGGELFDFICRSVGLHHSDPHEIAHWGKAPVLANSSATWWFFCTTFVLGASLLGVSLPDLGGMALGTRKLLTLEGLLAFSLAGIALFKGRYVDASLTKVSLVFFTVMTGIGLPLVVWVVS